MRIHSLRLQNFKRFTDLAIEGIPDAAKLVLLIGSNGCGKSSVFDAFNWIANDVYKPPVTLNLKDMEDHYFIKDASRPKDCELVLDTNEGLFKRDTYSHTQSTPYDFMYGRSSLRIVPKIEVSLQPREVIALDGDAPVRSIDLDVRFQTDVREYARQINEAARAHMFNGSPLNNEDFRTHILGIQQKYIDSLNEALNRVLGADQSRTIRLENFDDATENKPIQLFFKKGLMRVPFDLLSHGEKQVVILILNFVVRQDFLKAKIIYIDEMDSHMNTKLQFDLIKEITENWIPDDSQLWTASHALGFIDYALQSKQAVVIDFDNLDFDVPQTLAPAPDGNTDVYEIAVPRDSLQKLIGGRELIFCEGKDTDYYSRLELSNVLFASRKFNKFQVFAQARAAQGLGLIDRDFLTDEEVDQFEDQFKFIKILRYYSVENYLFHPDNLSEHLGSSFDRASYVAAFMAEAGEVREAVAFSISKARDGYPFNTELQGDKRKAYQSNAKQVLEMLQCQDFETCYKVFPMKDYAKQLPQRVNLNPMKLAKTQWFKTEIAKLLPSHHST